MLLVVEVPEEAKAVELVVGVGVVQLLEELQLLQTRLLPVRQEYTTIFFFPISTNVALRVLLFSYYAASLTSARCF